MIKLLGKTVSDKIAAGEVVEKPVSVVKELVENSIDAGATQLIVEIKKGGSEYIRVTDDGSGIDPDEAEMAFLRHATSKIEFAEDLDALETLGFRGEALASICAVSRMELITKTRNNKTGIKVSMEGGVNVEKTPLGCPDGTTVVVRDLFYNTPARRKFMRSQASETSAVTDLMTKIALAYPNIKVRMISNDNVLFATRGTGDRLDALVTVLGRQITGKLLPVHSENDSFQLEGYISGPGESRANRKNQVYFVNGRTVSSKVLEKGVDQAYKERLFEGRYPMAYLFLRVKPDTIDVNIHPTKQEIRFDDNDAVSGFIKEAVKDALMSKDAIPEIKPERIPPSNVEKATFPHFDANKGSDEDPNKGFKEESNEGSNKKSVGTLDDTFLSRQKDKDDEHQISEKTIVKDSKQLDVKSLLSSIREEESKVMERQEEYVAEVKSIEPAKLDFSQLEYKGVIFATYIMAVLDDEFYMIDQHAAHERIFYEQLTERMEKEVKFSQQVMIPITFQCKRDDDDWMQPLAGFGFEIDEFGPYTFAARAIPEFFDISQAEEFLLDYVDMLDDIKDFESPMIKDKLATRACKSAVKANDDLKEAEIKQLLNDLAKCKNPYSCPHGRPTFIKMTRYDIEKRFKRV